MAAPVTKIYKLETLGFDPLHKELQLIAKDFAAIKKAKKEAEAGLGSASNAAEAAKYRSELQKIRIEEAELKKQRQQMINDAKAEQLAREAAIRDEKERAKAAQNTTGWYKRLTTEIRELGKAIKGVDNIGDNVSFQGQTLAFDAAIAKMKQLTAAEQEFRRQFAKDQTLVGEYTTGIVNAFKQMGLDDLVAGQVTRTQDKLNKLNLEFNDLQKELRETQAAGLATDSIEKQMIENRNEVIKLDTSLERLKTDLRGVTDIGNQINTSLSKGFSAVKSQLSSLVIQYIGVQALINQAQSQVSEAKISSDQFTNLEIQLDNNREAAEKLNDSLKALDTRTTLTGLQNIADIALRAGTTAENIAEVTKALDIVKVSFGKDFGSVEEGTETFAKLINIFFDDGEITGDRILKIGNSVRALANETVASVPFLTDFSGRMAGVKQIANVSLADILGLGAGFEEFKQSAETSSTALVKIIPKLAQDTEKFSKIAGISNEQFKTLINNNPAQALILVSEALVKSGGDIEKINTTLKDVSLSSEQIADNISAAAGSSLTEVSKALQDSEIGSGRITTILATLGGKADTFRERIARAGETIQETGAITDAFAKKNTNLAATLDKLAKKFADAGASKGFQITLGIFASVFAFLLQNLPIIIGLLTVYGLGWLTVAKSITVAGVATRVTNGQLVLQRLALIGSNIAMGASIILTTLLRSVVLAFNASLFIMNGILKGVTATMRLFGITTTAASGPLGVILAIIGLLAAAAFGLSKSFAGTANAMERQIRSQHALNEVQQRSLKIYSAQIAEIDAWVSVIKSAATSADTKKLAVEELTKINRLFGEAIKDNVIDLNKLDEAYARVTLAIIAQADAQASAELVAKKKQKLVAVTALRQEIEITTALGQDFIADTKKFTGEQAEILKQLQSASSTRDLFNPFEKTVVVKKGNLVAVLDELRLIEENANEEFQAFIRLKAENDLKLEKFIKDGTIEAKADEVDIAKLKLAIEKLDHEIETFIGTREDLTKKINERDKLQKELDKLLGKETKGPKVPKQTVINAEQKNDFKDIEAARDEELVRLNKAFIQKKDFQRRETELIKVSEDGRVELVKERRSVLIADEEAYLKEQLEINTNAIDAKIAILDAGIKTQEEQAKKAKTKERALLEKELAADKAKVQSLSLEKIKQEQETNDKIFEIRAKLLKDNLETEVKNTVEIVTKIKEDPKINETDKAQAQLDADKKLLELQINFNKAMDELEKTRNDVSKKNAEDRARELRTVEQRITDDAKNLALARIQDEKLVGDKLLAEFQTNINKQREAIINSNAKAKKKEAALKELDRQEEFGTLARQIAALKEQLPQYQKLLETKAITEKEYATFYDDYVNKIGELNEKFADELNKRNEIKITDVTTLISANVRALFSFNTINKDDDQATIDKKIALQKVFADTITETYNLAKVAMDGFFDAEQAQIQQSLDVNLKRLEIERDQQLALAQSKGEEESINKQFRAREEAANREAFEKNKKLQREQAKINLAIQLSNLAVIAFAPSPANIATLGIAGAIMYAIQAAIAIANYAANISRINSAKFEQGGMPGQVPKRGGRFKGKPHSKGGTPFGYGGEQYEAEVDELAIIRTKDVPGNKKYSISGTHTEIASALNTIGGGVNFRTGAKIRKLEKGAVLNEKQAVIEQRTKNKVIIEKLSLTKDQEISERLNQEKVQNEKETSEKIYKIRRELVEQDKALLIKTATRNLNRVVNNTFSTDLQKSEAHQEFIRTTFAIEKRYSNLITILDHRFNKTITNTSQTVQRKGTSSSTFAMGGVPGKGGEFGGRPHSQGGTPFMFKGRQYEAEVDELAVIRTRNAPKDKKFKVEGTQMQIASAINRIGGGVDFKPGASVRKFEGGGIIGSGLQAPVFTPTTASVINNQSDNKALEKFDDIKEAIIGLASATDRRIDRLEVRQVTRTVTDAQSKQVRQSNVGTL